MAKKFKLWLSLSPTNREGVILIVGLLLFNLIWSLLFAYVFYVTVSEPVAPLNLNISLGSALLSFFIAAVAEETLFRIIPLTIALRNSRISSVTLWTLTISSILFGLIHGDVRNILLQGVSGLVYGILFIKFSGVRKHWIYAGIITISAHFAFDVAVYLVTILGKSFAA